MSNEEERKINFIQNCLPKLIQNHNEEFRDQVIVKCDVRGNEQLDGFMSSLYFLNMQMKYSDGR